MVTNARIRPGGPSDPEAEALAVSNGRITSIGRRQEIERTVDAHTRILDAGGRTVLPGFVDAHVHLIWGYELGTWLDLTGRPSFQEVRRRLRRFAREHPDDAILVGHGFDYQALSDPELPGRRELDEIISDRPVVLSAWDGHTGWVNSRFLERVAPLLRTLGRETGEIVRDRRTGEPTGILHKVFDLTSHLPEFQSRRSVNGLRRMLDQAVRCGITTAFDVQVNFDELAVYEALRNRDELNVRIRAAIYHPRGTPKSDYPAFVASVARSHDDWLDVGAIKLYIDGVQETGTAALLRPYANDPRSRGSTVFRTDEYRAIVRELDRLGFQLLTHACGDRGVRIALDAYEVTARANRTSGRRHRIEHCENLDARDLPRFARLGVIPCMMPRHSAPELTGRWREAVGPVRTRAAFPWKELLASGAALSFSSDWPVADLNPMIGIHEAVNRVDLDGTPSPHRLTVEEAVRAYTAGAAFASHCEADRGVLKVGGYADFIVLDRDPFSIPTEKLREISVLETVVDGRVVWEDPELRGSSRVP